tara:strand:- start:1717 stop:1893 length:177 start_codon:yes stop_codon:yes gene_type:complete
MTKELLKKLQSQKLELVHLITLQAIVVRHMPDNGSLNNLHRALKLNNELINLIHNGNN